MKTSRANRIAYLHEQINWYRQLQYVIEQEEYDHNREIEHWEASGRIKQMENELAFLAKLTETPPQ